MTMNTLLTSKAWTILALLLFSGFPAFGEEKTGSAGAAEVNTPSLAQMLTYALQDEWAARAEYQAMLKKWPEIAK